jgi:WhiB family redox-sensing transcriptional regulator
MAVADAMRHPNVIVGPPARTHGAVRQADARMRRHVTVAPALLCQNEPDLFFSEDPADLRLAKELCRQCPIQTQCRTGALERGEPWGVWGGELFQNGQVIADKRPRGRPRKAAVAA